MKNDSAFIVKVVKNYDILRVDLPTTSGTFDVERISTGTRFALEQFYARKENSARLWIWKDINSCACENLFILLC